MKISSEEVLIFMVKTGEYYLLLLAYFLVALYNFEVYT